MNTEGMQKEFISLIKGRKWSPQTGDVVLQVAKNQPCRIGILVSPNKVIWSERYAKDIPEGIGLNKVMDYLENNREFFWNYLSASVQISPSGNLLWEFSGRQELFSKQVQLKSTMYRHLMRFFAYEAGAIEVDVPVWVIVNVP